ncbi:hypothetical protein D3C87_1287320 [compost metagenome]
MKLLEFIKSKLSEDSPIGTLANDIKDSSDFPVDKTEKEILSYLDFQTRMGGTNDIYKSFLKEYKSQAVSDTPENNVEKILDETKILKSERWQYYKEFYCVDKVYLIGNPDKIYKVYCCDSKRKTALLFSLESNSDLNDIALIEECNIYIGDLTSITSVAKALDSLSIEKYMNDQLINKLKLTELLDFLKRNNN